MTEWPTLTGNFIALWTTQTHAHALFTQTHAAIPLEDGAYPALSPLYPGAAWFERLAYDLNHHNATGADLKRTAIDHHRGPDGKAPWPEFPPPEGDGIHQIAVGPIHAGIIEPGHFRFSTLGEHILRLEARLGYSHKGTLGLMRGKSPRLAARFAARVSGDATIAHSLAFAEAAEAALATPPPPRARALRAVMLELERLANHAGDIGAIAADAGFAFLESRFAWHRESLCAAANAAFGHRLMMDLVIPGGLAADIAENGEAYLHNALTALETELPALTRIFEDYASLQDRLVGIGIIPLALAQAYAPGGPVARASGLQTDARLAHPLYTELALAIPLDADGDVAARLRIRLAELPESIRLIRTILAALPATELSTPLPATEGEAIGITESFRGPIHTWLRIDAGQITDLFIADPSTLHWPLLERAALSGIVADFPLINKSINPSYSGVDL